MNSPLCEATFPQANGEHRGDIPSDVPAAYAFPVTFPTFAIFPYLAMAKKKKKTRHLHHVCYARSVNASARRQRDFAQERDQSLIRRDGWCGIPMHYIVAALFIAGVMPPAGLRYRSQIGRRVVVLTAIRPRDFSIRFTRPFSTLPPRGSRKESKRTRERARKKERGISREWRSRD